MFSKILATCSMYMYILLQMYTKNKEKKNLQTSTWKLSCGWPTMDPIHDNTPLKNARKARKAIKLAAMLATKAMAVLAPLAAASMTFLSVLKTSTTYLRIKSS